LLAASKGKPHSSGQTQERAPEISHAGDRPVTENSRRVVILLHGIQSNGAWHDEVAEVLEPHFKCYPIKYREFHSLGPVTMFFWLWAIPLAGLLGWWTLLAPVPEWSRWSFLILLAFVTLIEGFRSGLARTVPWLIVGSFFVSSQEDWLLWLVPLACWWLLTAASILGGECHRRRICFLSFRLAAGAILLSALSWAIGRASIVIFPEWFGPTGLLRLVLVISAAFVAWREVDWMAREKDLRLQMWWKRVIHLKWVAALVAIVLFASFLFDEPIRSLFLWCGIVCLMLFLELNETAKKGSLSNQWRSIVVAIALGCALAWICLAWNPWTGYLATLVLLVLGGLEPLWRYKRTTEHIHLLMQGAHAGFGVRPSIVAHSLGTFLTGETLEEFDLSYDRILFVGGAITELFQWQPFIAGAVPHVNYVRNEYGGKDLVINLLRLSGPWAHRHGLGGAGFFGLRPPLPTVVHDVENIRGACTECIAPEVARVHNYFLDRFRHSTGTLRRSHVNDYWLPYLWGHGPSDVFSFLDGCKELLQAAENRKNDEPTFRRLRHRLQQELTWNWYQRSREPQNLNAYVIESLAASLTLLDDDFPGQPVRPSESVQEEAALILCRLVCAGWLAASDRDQLTKEDQEERLGWLNPHRAIQEAARRAYDRVRKRLLR
jgi:hypothetical protein